MDFHGFSVIVIPRLSFGGPMDFHGFHPLVPKRIHPINPLSQGARFHPIQSRQQRSMRPNAEYLVWVSWFPGPHTFQTSSCGCPGFQAHIHFKLSCVGVLVSRPTHISTILAGVLVSRPLYIQTILRGCPGLQAHIHFNLSRVGFLVSRPTYISTHPAWVFWFPGPHAFQLSQVGVLVSRPTYMLH